MTSMEMSGVGGGVSSKPVVFDLSEFSPLKPNIFEASRTTRSVAVVIEQRKII